MVEGKQKQSQQIIDKLEKIKERKRKRGIVDEEEDSEDIEAAEEAMRLEAEEAERKLEKIREARDAALRAKVEKAKKAFSVMVAPKAVVSSKKSQVPLLAFAPVAVQADKFRSSALSKVVRSAPIPSYKYSRRKVSLQAASVAFMISQS